ncbi:hypothetical protein DY000_02029216 [Brassica cretica]|uniref:Uncharacterized protein n=1 Tax=Brassica cretica TaxID=69181 RepID=A0ABQ7DYW0_BRACR|nr:hypothetical protein DY000_02029216 [Brassica cretica]
MVSSAKLTPLPKRGRSLFIAASVLPMKKLVITYCCLAHLMLWTCASAPTAPNVLKMLVIQTLTYSIWQQRNNMLHNKSLILALVLFKDINRQIKV